MCNLAWGEAGFDSWATFGGVVVPLLGRYALALHFAKAYLAQKIKNLPDAGFWLLVSDCCLCCPLAGLVLTFAVDPCGTLLRGNFGLVLYIVF